MKKYLIIAALCTLVILVAYHLYMKYSAGQFSKSNALSIVRSGSFKLDMKPEAAIPLFTAPGEKLWVPNWNPTILKGDGFEQGTIFVTSNHGSKTHWIVMDYNTKAYHALYARVTPGHTAGTVEVSIKPDDKSGSTVYVTYKLTSLSQRGNKELSESFSEPRYYQMMEEWRDLINSSGEKIDEHFAGES